MGVTIKIYAKYLRTCKKSYLPEIFWKYCSLLFLGFSGEVQESNDDISRAFHRYTKRGSPQDALRPLFLSADCTPFQDFEDEHE